MNKTMKRFIMLIFILTFPIFLSSCISEGGGNEIDRIAIVTSVGIDYEDDQVVVTCEIVNPTSDNNRSEATTNSNSQGFVYAQGRGHTVREAMEEMNLHFDKKIFLSHSNLLIIGEEFAKRGIIDLMDFFMRDNEPREDMYVVIAKECNAYDVIGVRAGLGRASGNYLYDILNNFTNNGRSINISFAEKYRYFYDVGNEPVIGVVQVREVRQIDKEKAIQEPTIKILDVSGGAALKRDYLLGYFTADEMVGFNFIVGDIRGGTIVFKTPINPNDDVSIIGKNGEFTTVNILKASTKRKISIKDGKIHLTVDVKLRGRLNEINQAIDVSDPKVIPRIEDACSKKVEELISATLDKGQKEFKQDNFSIGVAVHQQYPKIWKEIALDWEDIFPEISYDVNVETTIVRTGLINTPANVRKRR